MSGTVTLKIHQKVKVANGEQWLEVWSRVEQVESSFALELGTVRLEWSSRVVTLIRGARTALSDLRSKFPGVEFHGTSTVETMGDW